jgi:shikimate dehydrogenase
MTEPGTPRRAAVLGSPIAHSLSPVLHRAAYAELGLPWSYDAVEVSPAGLAAFLDGLDETWAGLSLTMPLKAAVLPLLTSVSDLARGVGAVNTVLLPQRRGENTDVPGMVAALTAHGISRLGSAAVLGGGATARSALAALGPLTDTPVRVFARGPEREAELRAAAARLGLDVQVRHWADAARAVEADLVVSTTPASAGESRAGEWPRACVLFDVVYDPWPTALARAASAAGATVIGGLDLLVGQAALQVELMTGRAAPVEAMRRAGEAALRRR